jgi:hypothetical protein
MPKCRPKKVSNPVALVGLLTCAVSFVAAAEEAKPAATPQATAETTAVKPPQKAFYRGSSLSYAHSLGVTTITGEPGYGFYDPNPTWSHRLELVPEFHVGDQFFARARLALEQEFTDVDAPTGNHEVMLSDLGVEAGVAGVTIPVVGIHVGGNVRFTFPTSKASQARTMVMTVGPALSLSRKFPLLSGLTVAYAGRYTYRFHRLTEGYVMTNEGCIEAMQTTCREPMGVNTHSDLTHGPALTFSPLDALTVATNFAISHRWQYAPSQVDGLANQTNPSTFNTIFDLSVSYQLFRPVGLTLGASTFTPGLNAQGSNLFVLFNRNTTLYLDATVDIEAAVKGILGDPS